MKRDGSAEVFWRCHLSFVRSGKVGMSGKNGLIENEPLLSGKTYRPVKSDPHAGCMSSGPDFLTFRPPDSKNGPRMQNPDGRVRICPCTLASLHIP